MTSGVARRTQAALASMTPVAGLGALLSPSSIAVIGASRTPRTMGHELVANLIRNSVRSRARCFTPVAIPGYSALYSPTPLARRVRRTRDWVILDLEVPGPNLRWTVVTEFRGVLKGKRVVRGREIECYEHYRGEPRRIVAA